MDQAAPLWVQVITYLMAIGIPSIFLAFGLWNLIKVRRLMEITRTTARCQPDHDPSRYAPNGTSLK